MGLLAVGIAKVMGARKMWAASYTIDYEKEHYFYSYAADIVEGRLQSAKLIGADVVINCKTENLRDRSEYNSIANDQ